MAIQAFEFNRRTFALKVIDQTQLPKQLVYVEINTVEDAYEAIKRMWVRGAPCIAAVGCLSIIVELNKLESTYLRDSTDLIRWLEEKSIYLIESRPTAVNLKQALEKIISFTKKRTDQDIRILKDELTTFCADGVDRGKKANRSLGEFGADELLTDCGRGLGLTVLTHCNTGALATVGHGTALGVIKSLHEMGKLSVAYCTETRPYNQGSRLTAWELLTGGVPSTLIADDMVAHLMATKSVDAVIVGADRVAANGDTANKIGTLQIAIIAKHYRVPFYVAAPSQSIDLELETGDSIVIEHRPGDELRKIGDVQLTPESMNVWNPCFDVTPAGLISCIITEYGAAKTHLLKEFLKQNYQPEDEALF